MATLNNIKVGQVLHSYHKYKSNAGSVAGHWEVRVLEIDHSARRALCSKEGGRHIWYNENMLKKLLVKPKAGKQ